MYVWEKTNAVKGGNRKFNRMGVHHVYQRAQDRGIIFYSVIDRLVYHSILSVKSREYKIRVLAVAIMYSHVHQSCMAETKERLYKYIQDSSSIFARMHNLHYGRHGSLFSRPFGSSLKRTAKEIRSNLAYVNNNHTEKGLCQSALQAKWNLLTYREKRNPRKFASDISPNLIRAYLLVDRMVLTNKYLTYRKINDMFKDLNDAEKESLTDYILSRYPLVDYETAEGFFGGFDKMLAAFDSNTGSEYGIREEYSAAPDTAYTEMISCAEKHSLLGTAKPLLLRLTEEKRQQMVPGFLQKTSARKFQACKFLHLPDPESPYCGGIYPQ